LTDSPVIREDNQKLPAACSSSLVKRDRDYASCNQRKHATNTWRSYRLYLYCWQSRRKHQVCNQRVTTFFM